MTNKKIRILFLSPLPPPHYGSAMSSKTCLDILVKSEYFDVKNIKLNYSDEMRDIGKLNLKKIFGIRKVARKIREVTKIFKPDLIYFVPATSGRGLIRDSYFAKILNKKYRGNILYHVRSRIIEKTRKNPLTKKLLNQMFKDNKAIVLDEKLKEDLKKVIKSRNIFVLPNAIKNEVSKNKFNEIIKKRKNQKIFSILFLSNMDKTKGWPKLLNACKILDERKISFRCNFVGDFSDKKSKNKFNNFLKKNEMKNKIAYLGKKTGKEKNKILEKSDILVFPTEYHLETFGRVIIEAMMYGLPVIANGIASIPTTIVHNQTGFVLKMNTPEEIANYIEKLSEDKRLREKMGSEGRKRFLNKYELMRYEGNFKKIISNFNKNIIKKL